MQCAPFRISRARGRHAPPRPASDPRRPIIGILSLPNDIPGYEKYNSYFAASYVKWLEQAGARVVPLLFDSDLDTLRATLKNINGALFTGGGAALTNPDGSLTQVGLAGQAIFNESLNAWAAGETWPLWGTCQGHELVSILASGVDASILTPFDAENITLPLTFTPAASSSRLYGGLTQQVLNIFATEPVTMNNHMYGVAPADFYASTPLASRCVACCPVTGIGATHTHTRHLRHHPRSNGVPWRRPTWQPLSSHHHAAAAAGACVFATVLFRWCVVRGGVGVVRAAGSRSCPTTRTARARRSCRPWRARAACQCTRPSTTPRRCVRA